jgi:hypothetical protein
MRQRFAGLPDVEWRSGGPLPGDDGAEIGEGSDSMIAVQHERSD